MTPSTTGPSISGPSIGGTAPAQVHRVVRLLQVNLGLSALLALLFAVFHQQLLDFQVARLGGPVPDGVREGLSAGLWSRVATVAIIAIVYFFLIRRLRAGHRRAYIRVLVLSVASLLGVAYLALSGQYPIWVDAEQVVQGLVLLTLLWAVTRPQVRSYFAK
jgi:hypothetical protein